MNVIDQITYNTIAGPSFEDDNSVAQPVENPLVRLIAFYLPQFHAIPENDAWWGKGFTEWTNITKAMPRFEGHYQPRLPGELGFYDLTQANTLHRQAAMARRYGVGGFCFHHYWFAGTRLLEQPINVLLANPDIDLPFCINWANESWTRRWDGHEKSILMAQKHSPEDDIAFAESLEPYFRDPRYIRVMGRPLMMLYRPSMLPDAAATVERWRGHFVRAGLGDPYITMAQAFGDGDAGKYGMDAAVGFPPFWASGSLAKQQPALLDPGHRGEVFDYAAMADATADGYARDREAGRKVFPGVCPSWDNEARKPGRGTCFTGSTPEKYGRWLDAACAAAIDAFPPEERLVFVNAWNEWAEGAYLEPDRHFGYAYLAHTARVLNALTPLPRTATRARPSEAPMTSAMPPRPAARRLTRKVLNRLAVLADDIAWKLRGN